MAWLTEIWSWLQLPLLAGIIGLLSGLTELIGAFGNETGRALRTFGGWLLLGVNFLGAALIFLLVAGVAPGAQNVWAAIVVGLAWPTVVRNLSIKLGQPLDTDTNQQSAALRLEQAYGTVQKLSKQMIDSDIVRQRMRLLRELTTLDLQELERLARMAVILSKQADPKEALAFIDQIMDQREQREIKKAMLAANILNNFGRDTLEDIMEQLRKGQLPAIKEPPRTPPKEQDPTI